MNRRGLELPSLVNWVSDTCVSSLTVINATINQLESKVLYINNNLLPEAICCCLQTFNVVASEEIVGETCVPSLIVSNTNYYQL